MSVGNILVQGVAFLVILLLLVLTALGTWIVPGPEPVYLKGGPRFEQDITADAIAALVASRGMASPPQRTYFVAQYERPLTPSERTRLASQIDVEFLDAIPANAYIVSVPTVGGGPVMQRLFLSDPAARTLVDIKEKDKLSQQLYFVDPNTGLLVEDIPAGISYIQSPGVLGATNLAMFVRFYADVPLARQRELLKDYTDDDEDEHVDATAPSFGLWTVMVPAGSLVALAELPEVQSIEPGLPPLVNDMDVAGPWVGAAASVVETGSGVRMGQWEKCMPDNSHADLGNVIKMDVDSVLCENGSNDHATMVAGAIVADGSTFSNYPGIAPDAEILAFDVNSFPSEIIDEYVTALLLGTTLTNSSFGFEIDDLFFEVMSEPHLWYRTMNGHYDRVTSARTASGEMIATGRKITVVASTGNRGDDAWWSGTRVRNSAKNVITVGGISTGPDAANNAPMSQGGRGPTGDGRLSPLLVAPSIEYKPDDWGIKSSFPGNGQGQSWGTSFSTPIVSGVAALASEKFVAKCGGGPPAPADLRAVLVHTAEDLTDAGMEVFGLDNPEGNPPMRSKMQSSASIHPEVNPVLQYIGPDFIFGYGLVKANKAVEIIGRSRFVRDSIEQGLINYPVHIDNDSLDNGERLRVTLAWDDPPFSDSGSVPSPSTGFLQNDLDLVVIDPDGKRYYPWVLDKDTPGALATQSTSEDDFDAGPVKRDKRNTIEQVDIAFPTASLGDTWTIQVRGANMLLGPQDFTLVSEAIKPATSCGEIPSTVDLFPPQPPDSPFEFCLLIIALVMLALLLFVLLRWVYYYYLQEAGPTRAYLMTFLALLFVLLVLYLLLHGVIVAVAVLIAAFVAYFYANPP